MQFDARYTRTGMDGRNASIRAKNQVRNLPEHVAPAARSIVIVREEAHVLHQLEIEIERAGARCGREFLLGVRIVNLEGAFDARELDMEFLAGVKRELGDDVRVQARCGEGRVSIIQLGACQRRKRGWKRDRAAAGRASHVLLGILERNPKGGLR